ncbi:MAG: hypothetical protein WCG87_03150 [Bacteroidota bacterium]
MKKGIIAAMMLMILCFVTVDRSYAASFGPRGHHMHHGHHSHHGHHRLHKKKMKETPATKVESATIKPN